MLWIFKEFYQAVPEIFEQVLKIKVLHKVALGMVLRKKVSFQDRKKGKTPKFPSIEIWYNAALRWYFID